MRKQKTERKLAEKVVDKRIVQGKAFYYVLWRGEQAGTWVSITRLARIHHLVKHFESSLKIKRRRQLQRRLQLIANRNQANKSPSQQPLKLEEVLDTSNFPSLIAPENCISLISDSENSQQQALQQQEKLISTSRFDCVRGIWVNVSYTADQLKAIDELRNRVAGRHDTQRVIIRNIVKLNGQLIVQYERSSKRYQCLLRNFKSYMPQLLIRFLLERYNPAYHQFQHPPQQYESFSDSDD